MLALLVQLPHLPGIPPQYHGLVWGVVLASVGLGLVTKMMTALAKGFKTCPSCQKVVPIKAQVCQYCRHTFPESAETQKAS